MKGAYAMKPFQNILVGLDLAACKPLTTTGLGPIPRDAFRRGVELAKMSNARLLLFAALNVSEEALNFLQEPQRTRVVSHLVAAAERVLSVLEQDGKKEGAQA